MNYRTLQQIYAKGYPLPPDEGEVMLRCKRWFYDACETHNPNIFTQAINAIIDPFERELSVTHMHEVILRESAVEGIPMNAIMMEKIEDDFRRIIRRAQADQLLDTMDVVEEDIKQPVTPVHASVHIQCMEERIALLEEEVRRLKDDAQKKQQQPTVAHWPYFTDKATDDDKRVFEDYLLKLCQSKKKSKTQDIKQYLQIKEEQGIILRPVQLNREYEVLQQFGYNCQPKTYYN